MRVGKETSAREKDHMFHAKYLDNRLVLPSWKTLFCISTILPSGRHDIGKATADSGEGKINYMTYFKYNLPTTISVPASVWIRSCRTTTSERMSDSISEAVV